MPQRPVLIDQRRPFEDVYGNNLAFACPVCGKIYIVSGLRGSRSCPTCGQSTGFIDEHGHNPRIEWNNPPG